MSTSGLLPRGPAAESKIQCSTPSPARLSCLLDDGPVDSTPPPSSAGIRPTALGRKNHLSPDLTSVALATICSFNVLAAVMLDDAGRPVLTDEPYNCPISGHVTKKDHREFVMAAGELNAAEFAAFNLAWMEAALLHLVDGGIFGTFIDSRGYPT